LLKMDHQLERRADTNREPDEDDEDEEEDISQYEQSQAEQTNLRRCNEAIKQNIMVIKGLMETVHDLKSRIRRDMQYEVKNATLLKTANTRNHKLSWDMETMQGEIDLVQGELMRLTDSQFRLLPSNAPEHSQEIATETLLDFYSRNNKINREKNMELQNEIHQLKSATREKDEEYRKDLQLAMSTTEKGTVKTYAWNERNDKTENTHTRDDSHTEEETRHEVQNDDDVSGGFSDDGDVRPPKSAKKTKMIVREWFQHLQKDSGSASGSASASTSGYAQRIRDHSRRLKHASGTGPLRGTSFDRSGDSANYDGAAGGRATQKH
jgi:hypothetical protein